MSAAGRSSGFFAGPKGMQEQFSSHLLTCIAIELMLNFVKLARRLLSLPSPRRSRIPVCRCRKAPEGCSQKPAPEGWVQLEAGAGGVQPGRRRGGGAVRGRRRGGSAVRGRRRGGGAVRGRRRRGAVTGRRRGGGAVRGRRRRGADRGRVFSLVAMPVAPGGLPLRRIRSSFTTCPARLSALSQARRSLMPASFRVQQPFPAGRCRHCSF